MQVLLEKIPVGSEEKSIQNNKPYMYDTDGSRAQRHIDVRAFNQSIYMRGARWLNDHPDELRKYHRLPQYNVDNGSWKNTWVKPLHACAIFKCALDLMEPEEIFNLHKNGYKSNTRTLKEQINSPTEGPQHTNPFLNGSKLQETDIFDVIEDYIYLHPEKFLAFKGELNTRHKKKFVPPYFIGSKYTDQYLAIIQAQSQLNTKSFENNARTIAEVEVMIRQTGVFSDVEIAIKFNEEGCLEVKFRTQKLEALQAIQWIQDKVFGLVFDEQTLIIPFMQISNFKNHLYAIEHPGQTQGLSQISLSDQDLLEMLSKKLISNPDSSLMAEDLKPILERPTTVGLRLINTLLLKCRETAYSDGTFPFSSSRTQDAHEFLLRNAFFEILNHGLMYGKEDRAQIHQVARACEWMGWGVNRYRVEKVLDEYPVKQESNTSNGPRR